MKTLLFVLVFLGCSWESFSQSTNENVLVSSSYSISQNGYSLDWIVGDNFTDYQVLFGYQATDALLPALQDNAWVVGPVMTEGSITISSSEIEPGFFWVKVCDETSRTLILTRWESNPQEINLSNLATGPYVVVICNAKDATFARFKILKK